MTALAAILGRRHRGVSATPQVADSIVISGPSSVVNTHQTAAYVATVYDANGNVMSGATVTWVSSVPAKATVNVSGVASALATGATDITATIGAVTSNAVTLTVGAQVATTVVVTPSPATVTVGNTTDLDATVYDQVSGDAHVITGASVSWASDDTDKATVNSSTGVVTGVASGSATITATSGSADGTCDVDVADPPLVVTSVTVTPDTFSVTAGSTRQLAATVNDQFGNPMLSETVTWDTNDHAVATVDSSGLVTALVAGSVTVTATSVTDGTKSDGSLGTVDAGTGITWATRGIHPDAFISDSGANYLGANDAAKTTALRANIRTNAGGTGGAGSLYGDGVHGELASIVSTVTLDGHAVIDYTQTVGTINTPQLAAIFASPKDSIWMRIKTRFPTGWTRQGSGTGAPGYKLYGWGWQGADLRGSIEFNGQQVYITESMNGTGIRGGTADTIYTTIPDPIVSAQWYDTIVLSYKSDSKTRRQLVWFAIDGNEPQLMADQYCMTSLGNMPAIARFMLGLNINLSPASTQHLQHAQWECIDYANNSDPWGLVALQGVSLANIRMANAMTLTNAAGTVDIQSQGGTLTLTGSHFQDAPLGYFGVQVYNADGQTPLLLATPTVVNSTTMTVAVDTNNAGQDTPAGTYYIGAIPTGGYPGLVRAQTPPFAFAVIDSGAASPDTPTVGSSSAQSSSTLSYPVTDPGTGGVPTKVFAEVDENGTSSWVAQSEINWTQGGGGTQTVVVTALTAAKNYTGKIRFKLKNLTGTSSASSTVADGTTDAAPTVVFDDTFTETSGNPDLAAHTPEIGTWVQIAPSIIVNSSTDKAQDNDGNNDNVYLTSALGAYDYTVAAYGFEGGFVGNTNPSLGCRFTTIAGDDGYVFGYDASAGQYYVYSYVAANFVATFADGPPTSGLDWVLVVSGANGELFVGGVSKISYGSLGNTTDGDRSMLTFANFSGSAGIFKITRFTITT